MLAVARKPMTSQEPSLISTSSFGSRWARNHCWPSRSASGPATTTQRASELLEPNEKSPDTRKPASTATDLAFGSKVPQQATGPLPNTSQRALTPAPMCTKVLPVFEISMHQPAEPSGSVVPTTNLRASHAKGLDARP